MKSNASPSVEIASVPLTAGVSWTVDVDTDVASIGSENVTLMRALTGTLTEPVTGSIATIIGGVVSTTVPVLKYVTPTLPVLPARSCNGER